MMKLTLFICLFQMIVFVGHASEVRWDCFTKTSCSLDENHIFVSFPGFQDESLSSSIMPGLCIASSRSGQTISLSGSNHYVWLAFLGAWLEMSYGDVICYSTMSGRSDYFMSTSSLGMSDGNASTSIETTVGSSIYLAVIQETDGVFSEDPIDYYFGWIELYIEENGDVTLRNSAFSVDGSTMIVGGGAFVNTPEPTSGLLILTGYTFLFLRRKSVLH